MTDPFGNGAESFLFSVRKLCEEQVNKSDKLSLRVLTFFGGQNRHCVCVRYDFLSGGTRTVRIDYVGRDNRILTCVVTTDSTFLHLNLGMH